MTLMRQSEGEQGKIEASLLPGEWPVRLLHLVSTMTLLCGFTRNIPCLFWRGSRLAWSRLAIVDRSADMMKMVEEPKERNKCAGNGGCSEQAIKSFRTACINRKLGPTPANLRLPSNQFDQFINELASKNEPCQR